MSDNNMHAEDAVESKFAKTLVRFFIWVAPFVISAFAWFITSQLNDIKELQKVQSSKLEKAASDVSVLNTKLDSGVIWRITEIERRLNTVEQAQKSP